MKKHNSSGRFDDETVDRIAADFPVLSDDEKDRIFAMSERKYNISNKKNNDKYSERVSGVKIYDGSRRHRGLYAAAAAVVLAAGGFGCIRLAGAMRDSAPDRAFTDLSETSQERIPETTFAVDTDGYTDIATDLIWTYEAFVNPFHDFDYEQAYELSESTGEPYYLYYQVFDSASDDSSSEAYEYYLMPEYFSFENSGEIESYAEQFMTAECIEKQFGDLVADDMTRYSDQWSFISDEGGYIPTFGIYAMYDGYIYMRSPDCYSAYYNYSTQNMYNFMKPTYDFYGLSDDSFAENVEITDVTEGSFKAFIKYDLSSIPMVDTMIMSFTLLDGSWYISDIDYVHPAVDPDKSEIYEKMINSCDYYDRMSLQSVQISSYSTDDGNKYGADLFYANYDLDNASYFYIYNSIILENAEQLISGEATEPDFDVPGDEYDNWEYCDGKAKYFGSDTVYYDDDYGIVITRDISDKLRDIERVRIGSNGNSYTFERPMLNDNASSQTMALPYMSFFDKWDIIGTVDFCGRECSVIEIHALDFADLAGIGMGYAQLYVDNETGIILRKMLFDADGNISLAEIVYDIAYDEYAAPVPELDLSSFEYVDPADTEEDEEDLYNNIIATEDVRY